MRGLFPDCQARLPLEEHVPDGQRSIVRNELRIGRLRFAEFGAQCRDLRVQILHDDHKVFLTQPHLFDHILIVGAHRHVVAGSWRTRLELQDGHLVR
jgi:hypothetical protein